MRDGRQRRGAELLGRDLQHPPAQRQGHGRGQRLGAASPGDLVANPVPRLRHLRSAGGLPQPAAGHARGAAGYDYVGVGRDDGAAGGEYSAIFYKRSRFRLLDSGHFWLSEDPSKPGKGWDAKYVRICTWGRFYDRQSRQRFWFFTTHTDHRGEQAQAESCRLILAKIEELCRGERVILTGDFNVGETSRSYAILRDSGILSDTYDTAEIRYAETGTENWFDPDIKTFRRIDYLFVTPGFRVLRYGILTDTYRSENPDGGERKFRARTPSDHFPVQVELEFTKR